jgi:hypothetical protein
MTGGVQFVHIFLPLLIEQGHRTPTDYNPSFIKFQPSPITGRGSGKLRYGDLETQLF